MTTLYNYRIFGYQMDRLGVTEEQIASGASVSMFSVRMALAGHLGTLSRLRRIADFLKVKWEYITQVDLPESEFHRAVLTNGERTGRSVKSGPVYGSANRPRV
jgi:hypothetical protein